MNTKCKLFSISFFIVSFISIANSQPSSNIQKLNNEKHKLEKKLSLLDSLLQTEAAINNGNNQLLDSTMLDSLIADRTITTSEKGSAVNPFGDTLFLVYANIGSYTSAERTKAINSKIIEISKDPFFSADSLTVHKTLFNYEILYKNNLSVLTVTTIDASIARSEPQQLANDYLLKIRNGIEKTNEDNSTQQLALRLGWAVLIVVILLLIIKLVNFSSAKVSSIMLRHELEIENKTPMRYFKSLTGVQYKTLLTKSLSVLRFMVKGILIAIALTLLFNIFPITKTFTKTILIWVLDPAKHLLDAIISYLPNLFKIIVIALFFNYLIKVIRFFAFEISKNRIKVSGFYSDWAMTTFNIVRILLIAFSFIIIFPFLPGSNSIAFQGVSVFIGLIVSFGSSTAISNMVAGIVLTYMRAFKIGDRIKIGEITGDVIEKTALVTRIRTIKNEDITVPNANILTTNTINYSSNTGPDQKGLILHTTVTIGYTVPWKAMHEALINAALRTPFVLSDPQPFVYQSALNDFFVSYQINVYTHHANQQFDIYSELHKNIQDCCNEVGIEILSPHYRASRDGNAMAIPENYLSKDYKAPAFKVDLNSENTDLKS